MTACLGLTAETGMLAGHFRVMIIDRCFKGLTAGVW